jgi:protein-L-isoaspartate(D-aspartate) O-methyltransferase
LCRSVSRRVGAVDRSPGAPYPMGMTQGLSSRAAYPALACACLLASCASRNAPSPPAAQERAASSSADARFAELRSHMVSEQLAARDIHDPAVLEAMRSVPRHVFVPEAQREHAYDDTPLPIAAEQTISQPYIVALMSQLAEIARGDRVLEVGTGSGYQAAVLAALGAEVYSIEIIAELAASAQESLARAGYAAHVRHGDGYAGWPGHAPFQAILITAAPPAIPEPLLEQLAVGGRLVAPVGRGAQDLIVVTRTATGFDRKSVLPVRFVPMTGRAQDGL